MTEEKRILIGVGGGTCAGKTTLAKQIVKQLEEKTNILLIELHDYYNDFTHLPLSETEKINFDHPDYHRWDFLREHIDALLKGETVKMPWYSFKTRPPKLHYRFVKSANIIILDGLFALYDKKLNEKMSIRIFVDLEADIRFIRRLQRNINGRGETAESVTKRYLTTVREMHNKFVEPTRKYADIIIPGYFDESIINSLKMNLLKALNI